LLHDVYVHRDTEVTHELRARAAAALLPHAVITGHSAAVLWGVDIAGPEDDVEVTLPPGSHMVRVLGLRTRRAALDPTHVWSRKGIAATSPEETALRLGTTLPLDAAVVAADQLIRTGAVDLIGMRRHVASARGPGSARARRVADLADGLAESPQETRLRLLIGRSQLPAPVAQFRVVVDGHRVARVDFAWPEKKVALEYDGLWHAEVGQFARDRQRLNRLQAAGWRVVFVTAADLHHSERLIERIVVALAC
jgi:very-short-patch-repair endonuclease